MLARRQSGFDGASYPSNEPYSPKQRYTIWRAVATRLRRCLVSASRPCASAMRLFAPLRMCDRHSLARFLWRLTVSTVVAAVIPAVYEMHRQHYERHVIAWFVAGVFSGLSVLLAVDQILMHLINYRQPHLQKYVVRILWMVPIYATNSWFGLRFKHISMYVDVLREAYEAFVIYSFVKYLMTYLGSEVQLASKLAVQPVTRHMAPFSWLGLLAGRCSMCRCFNHCIDWELPSEFINNSRAGVLQYVVIKPLTSLLIFVMESYGVYGNGEVNWYKGYVYITFINNCSQIWALYILVLFYQATKKHLVDIHPLPKFLAVKAVVFFTWWQSIGIAILIHMKVLTGTDFYSKDDVASGLQNFLICIEMFVAALWHRNVFSHVDYMNADPQYIDDIESSERRSLISKVIDSIKPVDIVEDMKGVVREGHQKLGVENLLIAQWAASNQRKKRRP